jgi:phage repressor protein C with HTH and peptisase S24 domain
MENSSEIFRNNVNRLLKERGIKQRELARQVNCTYEHLNAVLKGRSKLSRALMEDIARTLHLTLGQLMEPEHIKASSEEPASYQAGPGDDNPYITWVPFLESKLDEEAQAVRVSRVKAPIAFKTEWLFQLGSPDQMAFVRTVGKSLAGEIPDNSMVIIDRSQTVIVSGSPYFLRIDDEMVIKRIWREKGGKTITYDESLDDEKAAELEDDADWQVIGRCVWYSKVLN